MARAVLLLLPRGDRSSKAVCEPRSADERLNAHELGVGLMRWESLLAHAEDRGELRWRSLMNAFPSSIWGARRELLVDSLTGVVPATCDAEAGEPEEAVPDRTASSHAAPRSAAYAWITENQIPSKIRSGVQ